MQEFEQLPALDKIEAISGNNAVQIIPAPQSESKCEGLAEIVHDVCNMVTALDLYCDLLQAPGVLAAPFAHYGGELRLVAAACQRLTEKLVWLEPAQKSADALSEPFRVPAQTERNWKKVPPAPITNLAEELLANRNLLAALAGPSIAVTIDVQGGALPVRMTGEDLTRTLVNLIKNAAEAMSSVGRIQITLWESSMDSGDIPWLTLNIEDNGPGLAENLLDRIFEPHSSEPQPISAGAEWPSRRHGLGLSITRSIVEAAGGFIHAANRDPAGACFQIQLPAQTA